MSILRSTGIELTVTCTKTGVHYAEAQKMQSAKFNILRPLRIELRLVYSVHEATCSWTATLRESILGKAGFLP